MIVRVEDLTYRYPENEEESLKGISFCCIQFVFLGEII
jgi:energy-coupling factor transporter ATP-binding protein EcfA2